MAAVFAGLTVVAAACAPGDPAGASRPPAAPAPTVDQTLIRAARFRFKPRTVRVPTGSITAWVNKDVAPHSVTTAGHSGPSVDLPLRAGATAQVQLDEVGIFRYYCTLHPRMSGRIVVTDA